MITADPPTINETNWQRHDPGFFRRLLRTFRSHSVPGARLLNAITVRAIRVGRRPKGRWLLKLIQFPERPCVTPVEEGFRLLIDPLHQPIIDLQLYLYGSYEPGTLRLMGQLITRGDGVLDVGANIGLMTCHAARCVGPEGHVIAFEPSAATFRVLEANVRLNDLENVTLVNRGAGLERGTAELFYRSDLGCGAATMMRRDEHAPDETIEIDRIDAVLAAVPHPPIRFVKIDVEGFELEALRGATALLAGDDAPIVCMEYSLEQENTAAQAADFLCERLDAFAFRTLRSKSVSDYGALVQLVAREDYPSHDNVFFVPRSRLAEVEAKLRVVRA
jgi:FkbM family methyltransferase